MKRKILQIICIGALLFSMSGCGFESVEDHDKKATTSSEKTNDKNKKKSKNKEDTSVVNEEKESKDLKKEEKAPTATDNKEETQTKDKKEESTQKKEQQPADNNTLNTPQSPAPAQPVAQYVTVQIDVLTMLNNMDKVAENKKAYVPSSGWILPPMQLEIQEGDTAFSVLERATQMNRIPISYQGASGNVYNTVYVQGIAQLFEFDGGQGSGWMYYVNGSYSSVGSSAYTVKNGDVIAWRYTCDNGKDM